MFSGGNLFVSVTLLLNFSIKVRNLLVVHKFGGQTPQRGRGKK